MKKLVIILVSALAGLALQSAAAESDSAGFTPPSSGHIPVAFVVTEGANVIDLAGSWEVFQDVMVEGRGSTHGESMPFELFTVGDRKAPVTATGGLKIVPEYTFADAPAPRIVVVGAQQGSPEMIAWLQKVAADPHTDVVMSVCTGAFKLAKAGLLDGKRATTHHDFFDALAKQYPKVTVERGPRFVRSSTHVFTAGGLTSGIDLALHVVGLYFGQATANRTAAYMEHAGAVWKKP